MRISFAVLSLALVVTGACKAKTPEGSGVKTLVEVASGGEFGSAICRGDGKRARVVSEYLRNGGAEAPTYGEFRTAASAMAALPPRLFDKLRNASTTLQFTSDPGAYCSQATGDGKRSTLGRIDACYVWTKRNGRQALDIALLGHWGKVGSTLVKEVGYVVAQNAGSLLEDDAGFAQQKRAVLQAFLRDMAGSQVFALEGLTPLIGEEGVKRLRVNAEKDADDLLAGIDADRAQITDFVFAEAFDSFYCRSRDKVATGDLEDLTALARRGGSKSAAKAAIASVTNTRIAMKTLFPRAHAAFLKIHDKHWSSGSGGFSLDGDDPFVSTTLGTPSEAGFPYADRGGGIDPGLTPSPVASAPVMAPTETPPMDFTNTALTPTTGVPVMGMGNSMPSADGSGIQMPGAPDPNAALGNGNNTAVPIARPPLLGGAFRAFPELYDSNLDYQVPYKSTLDAAGASSTGLSEADYTDRAIRERINSRAQEFESNPQLAQDLLKQKYDYRYDQEALKASGLEGNCGNLSPVECMSVRRYTENDYGALNAQARSDAAPVYRPSGDFRRVDGQERAEDAYVTLLAQRVATESAIEKMTADPKTGYEGTVSRWTNLPPSVLANYTPGTTVNVDGFTSTTLIQDANKLPSSLQEMEAGNTHLIIENARGANVRGLSAYGPTSGSDEQEVVLNPHTLQIMDRRTVTLPGGRQQELITARMVPRAGLAPTGGTARGAAGAGR